MFSSFHYIQIPYHYLAQFTRLEQSTLQSPTQQYYNWWKPPQVLISLHVPSSTISSTTVHYECHVKEKKMLFPLICFINSTIFTFNSYFKLISVVFFWIIIIYHDLSLPWHLQKMYILNWILIIMGRFLFTF